MALRIAQIMHHLLDGQSTTCDFEDNNWPDTAEKCHNNVLAVEASNSTSLYYFGAPCHNIHFRWGYKQLSPLQFQHRCPHEYDLIDYGSWECINICISRTNSKIKMMMGHLHCARNTNRSNISTMALHLSLIFIMDCERFDCVITTLSCHGLLNDIYTWIPIPREKASI